ncbi:MAG: peptide-methionine (S)-S-oxide reductase MsrA [Sediminibacterium sp.]
MKSFLTVIAAILFSSSVQSQSVKIPLPSKEKPSANEAVAYFAEGCFWHAEIVFQSLVGVRDAVSGFSGGKTTKVDYETVGSGKTGHAETVAVYYDPAKISYETLVAAFFASVDPTELNRQGNDVGTQYRSAAFYKTDAEKKILESAIQKLQASGKYKKKIVTEIAPFTKFYAADAYHQEYIHYHPDNGYVAQVSIPEFIEFKKNFKGSFKY